MSSAPIPSFVDMPSRIRAWTDQFKTLSWKIRSGIRVAMPGIVQSFDSVRQTVEVQLAIRENLLQDLVPVPTDIAPLLDVPVVMPRGGGFSVTLPVKAGDECLVVFGDMCIDSWWQNGNTNNVQMARRRHDLSDGFAILGPWSQPRVLANYSTTALQMRADDGSAIIEVGEGEVTVTVGANSFVLNSSGLTVNGPVNFTGATTIQGKAFLTHQHTGIQSGTSNSGPVL